MAAIDDAPRPSVAWSPATVAQVDLRLLDDPIAVPVRTSFGSMHSRPGLIVRLTDADGVQGFGEAWCNFPAGGARYKATLIEQYVRPALQGQRFAAPAEVQARLHALFAILRLQCADYGAMAQLIAAVDQAAWDLFGKRAGQPLWQLLGGRREVPVYASGIGPRHVAETVRAQHAAGHRGFKIKLGFDDATDHASLAAARDALPRGATLMVDINQGWTVEQAKAWLPRLAEAGIAWCEEPLRADAAWDDWRLLAALAPSLPIAGGENLLGEQRFVDAVERGAVRVLQPDLGKWGGISENLQLARRLQGTPASICPHWLAGGIGLMASLQFKAAIGGAGMVEMDANPNRQRSEAFAEPLVVRDGVVSLPDTPGVVPPLAPWLLEPQAWATPSPEHAPARTAPSA